MNTEYIPSKNETAGDSFLAPVPQESMMAELSRGVRAQEIQAALVVAKKFPRDQNKAFVRIMNACKRKSLAAKASYVFSRGGTMVNGASIDLMEVVAQNWGNIQAGVVELEQRDGESTMMAYAWDLETNFHDAKTFTVRHRRDTKKGSVELTDDRDIYENNANFAARRKRACLEAVIPRDVIEEARQACDDTLKNSEKEPLEDRVRKMVVAFAGIDVTTEMIEARLNHKLEAIIEQEFVLLRKIYKSIQDGMSKREDWFAVPTATEKAPSTPKRYSASGVAQKEKAPTTPPASQDNPPPQTEKTEPPKETTPPKQEEKQTPPPAEKSMVAVDRTKPFESLKALAKESDVKAAQILAYAKSIRMAKPSHKEIGEMREADLLRLVDSWVTILPEIRKQEVA